MNRRRLVEFYVDEVLRASEKALCCLIDGEEYWIPKSQIDADSEVSDAGDEGALWIPAWLAEERDLPV